MSSCLRAVFAVCWFAAFLSGPLVGLAGCSAIVGATCAEGFVLCAGRCALGTTCGSVDGGDASGLDGGDASGLDGGDASGLDGGDASGLDGGLVDSAFDSSTPDTGSIDTGSVDAGSIDAGSIDAGSVDAGSSDSGALDAPRTDAPGTDGGPPCIAPEVYCAPLCVDLTTDNEHCGACDNLCPSGLCVASTCVAAFSGHVVLIGHDYETSRIAMRRVVGNSVFLARTSPVGVLVYEGDTTAASRAGTDAAINATAAALGRTWVRTVAPTSAAVVARLPSADVLLVYAQRNATNATLTALGTAWGPALTPFLVRGGVLVVLDTASPTNAGTWQILAAAGLFTATGVTDVSLGAMRVVVPGDAVALGVPLTYRGERTTVRFSTSDGVVVVEDATGAPVVIHRTSVP